MIRFDEDSKNLKVPRSLGNQNAGGGPVSGITAEECQQMIDDSIDAYDDEVIDPLKEQVNGKSTVEWNQITSAGTKVAEITIDGTKTDVYAPTSGPGGGVTPEEVEGMIQSAITEDVQPQIDTLTGTTADLQGQIDDLTGQTADLDARLVDVENDMATTGDTADLQSQIDALTAQTASLETNKQDTLIPGAGIQISGNTISCTVQPGSGDSSVHVKIYHDNSEGNEFDQADLAQLQIVADALSGITDGNYPDVWIDLINPDGGIYYRFSLLYSQGIQQDPETGDDVPGNANFVASDVEGYSGNLWMDYADVSQSTVTYAEGYDPYIADYIDNNVQPQIDDLTGQTAALATEQDRAGRAIGALQSGKQDALTAGTGIQISGNTISCTVSGYTLPVATANVLGGVKIGSGLTIDSGGTVSVSGGSADPGYKWIDYDDYNDNWTTAQKEAWYDEVKNGYFNSGNTKFGVVKLIDKGYPDDDPTREPYCSYAVMTVYNLEAGYDSLQFQETCAGGVSGNQIKVRTARVQRGTNFEYWEATNEAPRSGDSLKRFKLQSNLQPATYDYYYFDAYDFARTFSETNGENDFYGHASYGAIQIIDNTNGDLLGVCNVQAFCPMPDNTYPNAEMISRVYFTYLLNGDLYDAIIDVAGQGAGSGLYVVKNVRNYLLNNWAGTQADYNAIGSGNYDPNLIYHIDR